MHPDEESQRVERAIRLIPCGLFIMTSAWEDRRSGVLAPWVQLCSLDPPMIVIALMKGLPIEPLVRDSRKFVLCQIAADDRFLQRRFAETPDRSEDPFVSFKTRETSSGAPIIERAMSYVECELVRHVDLDSNYRIFVGHILTGDVLNESPPAVAFGEFGAA